MADPNCEICWGSGSVYVDERSGYVPCACAGRLQRRPAEPQVAPEPGNGELSLWTIYDRPRDYPAHVVVRRHVVAGTLSMPTDDVHVCASIAEAREYILSIAPWAVVFPAESGDEPQIVESWL